MGVLVSDVVRFSGVCGARRTGVILTEVVGFSGACRAIRTDVFASADGFRPDLGLLFAMVAELFGRRAGCFDFAGPGFVLPNSLLLVPRSWPSAHKESIPRNIPIIRSRCKPLIRTPRGHGSAAANQAETQLQITFTDRYFLSIGCRDRIFTGGFILCATATNHVLGLSRFVYTAATRIRKCL